MGCEVDLYEMRTETRSTPAHKTTDFGELVCSNSLKSESENTAPWLLKQEMRRLGSALIKFADETAVPAGHALAVDRVEFSRRVTAAIEAEPKIRVIREEVTSLEGDGLAIVASGPLTSDALSREIERLTGAEHLAFYDSISPIVETDSIDMERVYMAARWDKGTPDYINCPMDREEYDRFYDALIGAEAAEAKEWEKAEYFPPQAPEAGARGPRYFEGCLPIEVLARRGKDTLRYGPMKPVGLRNPRTGKTPWAVVQLRKENLRSDSYNLVGFQNHLKWGEQARVLRLIPGLENAKFLRFGQIHRNTYICAPALLDNLLRLIPSICHPEQITTVCHPEQGNKVCHPERSLDREAFQTESKDLRLSFPPHSILFAGQLAGIEGYTESIATGMLAGLYAASLARGVEPEPVPRTSALGSLVNYMTRAEAKNYQPANMTFDLLEPLEEETRKKLRDKKLRHKMQCDRALEAFETWRAEFEQRLGTSQV